MNKPSRSAVESTAPAGAASLIRTLLRGLRRRPQELELAPPGRRSGEGSRSLWPYLEQARSTRPSPLE